MARRKTPGKTEAGTSDGCWQQDKGRQSSVVGRKTDMIRELSAGAVVLRRMKNQWWVAVIEPGREGEPEDRKHVIALPKGNIDPGEKPLETLTRELVIPKTQHNGSQTVLGICSLSP